MKFFLMLFLVEVMFVGITYSQTIVVDYKQELQDTVYVYNGNFLYDHTGTGQTQMFAECVGKMDCRLYFRFNGRYPYLTNYSTLVATTMDTKYTSSIRNWDYERMDYGGDVYTFDIAISKEALKKFSNTDILRFQIGNYLFTATDNIRYGLGKLYTRTERQKTRNKESIDLKTNKVPNGIPVTQVQLVKSARQGNLNEISFLLKSGKKPNFGLGKYSISPLIAASIKGHLSIVKLLIEYGAEVDGTYSKQHPATPLWYAANNGHVEVVNYLLKKGADPTVKNRNGWSAIRQASVRDYNKVIELLENAKQ